MFILANYLTEEGKADRSKIAADIVLGRLRDIDINRLSADALIRKSYFGDWPQASDLKQKSEWDEDYLNKLIGYNVSTIFNEDYMKHLYEVSQYLQRRSRTSNKMTAHSATRGHVRSHRHTVDIKRYLNEGRVVRSNIVTDIVMGELNEEDVRTLAQDARIRTSFFGDGLKGIELIDTGGDELADEEQLYKLMSYAVATTFNEEYLLYLCKVVSAVKKKFNHGNRIGSFFDSIKKLIQQFLAWITYNDRSGSNNNGNRFDSRSHERGRQ